MEVEVEGKDVKCYGEGLNRKKTKVGINTYQWELVQHQTPLRHQLS